MAAGRDAPGLWRPLERRAVAPRLSEAARAVYTASAFTVNTIPSIRMVLFVEPVSGPGSHLLDAVPRPRDLRVILRGVMQGATTRRRR